MVHPDYLIDFSPEDGGSSEKSVKRYQNARRHILSTCSPVLTETTNIEEPAAEVAICVDANRAEFLSRVACCAERRRPHG